MGRTGGIRAVRWEGNDREGEPFPSERRLAVASVLTATGKNACSLVAASSALATVQRGYGQFWRKGVPFALLVHRHAKH